MSFLLMLTNGYSSLATRSSEFSGRFEFRLLGLGSFSTKCESISGVSYRVSFHGFWRSFDPEKSVFYDLIADSLEGESVSICSNQENVDLEIHSVFQVTSLIKKGLDYVKGRYSRQEWNRYLEVHHFGYERKRRKLSPKRIWYTGENLRPPFLEYDLCLSYDPNDVFTNNYYFPIWYLKMDWGLSSTSRRRNPADYLLPRKLLGNNDFACIFSSYVDPQRARIIDAVEQATPVEKFGLAWGNYVPDKNSLASNYGIQICPENDVYPGYITEKLFEAYDCGNVPVWIGSDLHGHFNPDAIIDVTNKSYEDIVDYMTDLIMEDKLTQKRNEPLLKKIPNLDPVREAMRRLVSS
jgi:hypothetical protein